MLVGSRVLENGFISGAVRCSPMPHKTGAPNIPKFMCIGSIPIIDCGRAALSSIGKISEIGPSTNSREGFHSSVEGPSAAGNCLSEVVLLISCIPIIIVVS